MFTQHPQLTQSLSSLVDISSGSFATCLVVLKTKLLGEKPRCKYQKWMDFFPRLPSNSKPQELPCFLKRFQPTDTLHCVARTKHPVGRPKAPSPGYACTTSCPLHDENSLCVLAKHRLATRTSIIPRLVDTCKSYLDVVSIYLASWLFNSDLP